MSTPAKLPQSYTPFSKEAPTSRVSLFESLRKEESGNNPYWSARDLAKILGYIDYRDFFRVIQKARLACENSGQSGANHFAADTTSVSSRSGTVRMVSDIRLSRYACYLIVQNAHPAKERVALGQTYFAAQARRQENRDTLSRGTDLSEDARRLSLRSELSLHNKQLAAAARRAGVIESEDFRAFQNHGYAGLYGGLSGSELHERKRLKKSQQNLDYMSSSELAANLFRATQTEEKLLRDRVQGKEHANRTHFEVGREIRETIKRLGGRMPETLPTPATSVNQLARQEQNRQAWTRNEKRSKTGGKRSLFESRAPQGTPGRETTAW